MNLEVLYRKEFGKDRFYSLCDNSKLILSLMGRASFTLDQLKEMRAHGWDITVKREEIDL